MNRCKNQAILKANHDQSHWFLQLCNNLQKTWSTKVHCTTSTWIENFHLLRSKSIYFQKVINYQIQFVWLKLTWLADFGITLSAGSDRPSYLFQHYLLRNLAEGTWKSLSNGKCLALAFNDYDTVCFMTNRHTSKNTSTQSPKPSVINDWNKHCHYVDTFDQFVEEFDYPYKVLTVTRKLHTITSTKSETF